MLCWRMLTVCALWIAVNTLCAPVVAADITSRFDPSAYHGKYVVLDFWATWCGPCRQQLPKVKQFYEKIKGNQRVALVGISLDHSRQALTKMVTDQAIAWPQVYDGRGFDSPNVRRYRVHGIPHMVLLDGDGNILIPDGTFLTIQQALEQRLAQAPRGASPSGIASTAGQVTARQRPGSGVADERQDSIGSTSEPYVLTPEDRHRMDRALGATGSIEGDIRYDRRLLQLPAVFPQLSFQDEEQGTMPNLDWRVGPSTYEVRRVPIGHYTLTVVLDANPKNPPGLPGDFIALVPGLEVRQDERVRHDVTVHQLIRLLMPMDNHDPISQSYADPYPSHQGPVQFVWDTVPSATAYRYTVSKCDERLEQSTPIIVKSTWLGQCQIELPPSEPHQFYLFDVAAFDGDTLIGELVIQGKDFRGKEYRFVVAE